MQERGDRTRVWVICVVLACLAVPMAALAEWPACEKLLIPDSDRGDFFGSSVAVSGEYCIVGSRLDDARGYDFGSAYIFKREDGRWVLRQQLTPADYYTPAQFGVSVSMCRDRAIVGAPCANGKTGLAYILRLEADKWLVAQRLTALDGVRGDLFGRSVSISGDYAIVGANHDNDKGSYSGSAYIFKRNTDGRWIQQAKLRASDGAEYDRFGESVCISGDYAIVGAYYHNSDAGSAYIFKRSDTQWAEQSRLTAPDRAVGDFFGVSVSISGDRAIVGAGGDDAEKLNCGSAYVFERLDTGWVYRAKLTASDAAEGDQFGMAVSLDGDYCVVGALADADRGVGGKGAGSAYVSQFDGAKWVEHARLAASEGDAGDYFGISVSISPDTVVVGAAGDDDGAEDSGSAYAFRVCPLPDLNGDCWIDFADYAILAKTWRPHPAAGGAGGEAVGWPDLAKLADGWLDGDRY